MHVCERLNNVGECFELCMHCFVVQQGLLVHVLIYRHVAVFFFLCVCVLYVCKI